MRVRNSISVAQHLIAFSRQRIVHAQRLRELRSSTDLSRRLSPPVPSLLKISLCGFRRFARPRDGTRMYYYGINQDSRVTISGCSATTCIINDCHSCCKSFYWLNVVTFDASVKSIIRFIIDKYPRCHEFSPRLILLFLRLAAKWRMKVKVNSTWEDYAIY